MKKCSLRQGQRNPVLRTCGPHGCYAKLWMYVCGYTSVTILSLCSRGSANKDLYLSLCMYTYIWYAGLSAQRTKGEAIYRPSAQQYESYSRTLRLPLPEHCSVSVQFPCYFTNSYSNYYKKMPVIGFIYALKASNKSDH